jgi:hypothetical protein
MNISDEAVEAVASILYDLGERQLTHHFSDVQEVMLSDARQILEAAAPYLSAQAWDEGAEGAWARSTPAVNGTVYKWRHSGEPHNPYRPVGAGEY